MPDTKKTAPEQNLSSQEKRRTELRQIVLDWIKPKKRERKPANVNVPLPKSGWIMRIRQWWQKLRQIFQK